MYPSMWTSVYWELSPEEAVSRIASIGYAGVELSTEHLEVLRDSPDRDERIPAFGELVEELGIEMDQAHITITVDVANPDDERRMRDQDTVLRDLDMLSELGISHGVLHPGGYGQRATVDEVKRQNDLRLQAISTLAAAAERSGVRIALENGMRTTGPDGAIAWGGDITGLRALIAEINSPALGICLDTGHAILENWDVARAVREAGDLLIATHIADNDGSGDQHRLPYSYGSKVDWMQVMEALDEIGYAGPFNYEVPGERGRPFEILDAVVAHGLQLADILLGEDDD